MFAGRIRTSRVLVSLLSACLYVPVAAQTINASQESGSVRLASREEGEAIVETAWELRRGLAPKPDCSHFVNAVYSRAGLHYEYSSAREIFAGIDSFRRVQKPQPGDLIVWQGHMGIVVDPDEHTFYSSVFSGFALENYRSNYWARRGRPRFYRYLMDDAQSARLVAHRAAVQPLASQYEVSSLSAAPSFVTGNAKTPRRMSRQLRDSAAREEVDGDAKVSHIVVVSGHAVPSKAEVRSALLHLADANGERLPEHASLQPAQVLVVADLVAVTEIHVHGQSGWAQLESKSRASIPTITGESDLAGGERWQATLRREAGSWVLQAPQDLVYLRLTQAIRVLADQVAIMSRSPEQNRETRKTLKALEDLLSQENPRPAAD